MYKDENRRAQEARANRRAENIANRYRAEVEGQTMNAPGVNGAPTDRAYRRTYNRFKRHQEAFTRAQLTQDAYKAKQEAIEEAARPGYIQNKQEARQEKAQRTREEEIMSRIVRGTWTDQSGHNFNFAGGANVDDLGARAVELANYSATRDLTQAETDEFGAVIRTLTSNKDGIKFLNRVVNDRAVTSGVNSGGIRFTLSDGGLHRMNLFRNANSDVAAAMAKADKATTVQLTSALSKAPYTMEQVLGRNLPTGVNTAKVAGDLSAGYNITDAERRRIVQAALADTNDINNTSGGALDQQAWYLPERQIQDLVTDAQFNSLVPDAEKREILRRQYDYNILAATSRTLGPQRIVGGPGSMVFRPPMATGANPNGFHGGGAWSRRGTHDIYTETHVVNGKNVTRRWDATIGYFVR